MARLASEEKGVYYPHPLEELDLVLPRIQGPDSDGIINIGDFCCGEGEALAQIQNYLHNQGCEVVSYGCELEHGRAAKAKQKLDHVVQGAMEELQTSCSFSLLLCNPPYQDMSDGVRMEKWFLEAWTRKERWLVPNGIFLFVVPQHVLKTCAGIIANRLDAVRVYRFREPAYDVFGQVVLYGISRKPKMPRDVKAYLEKVAVLGPMGVPPLDYTDKNPVVYSIPTSPEVEKFRGEQLEPEVITRELQSSPLFSKAQDLFLPESVTSRAKAQRPLLPMKVAHYATVLMAGGVDGNMSSHWLESVSKQKTKAEPIYDDDGKLQREILHHYYQSITRIFVPDGQDVPPGVYDLE